MYSGNAVLDLAKDVDKTAIMKEIEECCDTHKFKGQGQRNIPVISYKGMLKLAMILESGRAFEVRSVFVDMMQRFFAGDPTLVPVLIENNRSNAPLNALARDATGVAQVVDADQFQQIAVSAFNTRYNELEDHFRKRRCLELNDRRTEEARREKERKHELKIEELKMRQVVVESQEKTKQAMEQEKTKQLEIERQKLEQQEKTKQLQIEQQEKTKQLEIEQQEKTKQLEIERQKLEQQEKTRQLELQIEMKKMELQTAERVDPCTIDRVSLHYKLLDDVEDTNRRKKILILAGKIAANPSYHLTLLPQKIKAVDSDFEVNQFDPLHTNKIKDIIKVAKLNEERENSKQIANKCIQGVRKINDLFQNQSQK
jgi:hypothetical protein